jgi:WD40 repeat protein
MKWLRQALLPLLLLTISPVVARAESDNLPVGTVTNVVDLYAVDHATFLSRGSKVLLRSWQAAYLSDVASRRLVRSFDYETYADVSIVSPDEQWMISGHRDGKVRVWNLATGAPAISLEGTTTGDEPEEISALAMSADGSLLAAGGKLGTITIWNLKTREKSQSFAFGELAGDPHIIALRLTADRKQLIAVTAGTVRTFDVATGGRLAALDLPNPPNKLNNRFFESSIVGDDGIVARYVTAFCEIGELLYFNLRNPDDTTLIDKPANCRKPQDDYTLGDPLLFANEARSTVLIAREGLPEIKEWDLTNRSVIKTVTWPDDAKPHLIGVDARFDRAADGGEHKVSIRAIDNGTSLGELEEVSYQADSAVLSMDGRSILLAQQVSGKDILQLTIWEVGAPDPGKVLQIAASSETTIQAFSPQAKLAAAITKSEFVLFSTETGRELRRLSVKQIKEPSEIRLSGDGQQALLLGSDANDEEIAFLVVTTDGTVRGQLGKPEKSKAGSDRDNRLTVGTFSPDGRRLALGRFDGTAEIWDTKTLKRIKLLARARGDDADQIRTLTFSADGKQLVAGSRDSGVFLWNTEAGGPPRAFQYDTLAGHVHFTSVAISHDGSLVAGALAMHSLSSGDAGPERSIRVWNAATGKLRFTLRGHQGAVARVTFSPDDSLIVSVGYDGTIRYWSAETGRNVATIIVTSDGHWIVLSDSGIYSGNPGEREPFNLVRGLSARPSADFRRQLYQPDVIEALLGGDKDHRYAAAARALDLGKVWDGAGP